jgi:hypothetical protein
MQLHKVAKLLSNLFPPTRATFLLSSAKPCFRLRRRSVAQHSAPGSCALSRAPLAVSLAKPCAMDHNTLLNIVIFARGCESAYALLPLLAPRIKLPVLRSPRTRRTLAVQFAVQRLDRASLENGLAGKMYN